MAIYAKMTLFTETDRKWHMSLLFLCCFCYNDKNIVYIQKSEKWVE